MNSDTRRYAHSLSGQPPERWQPLDVHLSQTATLAAQLAKPFGSAEWTFNAGWLHDLGKARKSFQDYLRLSNGMTDADYDASDHSHSGAGAVWAVQTFSRCNIGRILAYCVAGTWIETRRKPCNRGSRPSRTLRGRVN